MAVIVAAETPDAFEAFAATYLRLHRGLSESAEAQWMAGATPTPREDTTERMIGLVRDPVPTATLDTRRLALRSAVIESERALRDADEALRQAVAVLEASLERWSSEASGASGDG